MEIEACLSCGSKLPERAFYCPNCAKQVRCKNCRDTLEPDAKACVACGTLIGEGNKVQASANDGTKVSTVAANTIEFRETQKSRSLRATFTDTIGAGLNETLNSLLTNRVGAGRGMLQKSPYKPTIEQQLPVFAELSDSSNEIIDVGMNTQEQISTEGRTNTDGLTKVFRFNDDNSLTLMDARLKAKSKLEFARRLTFLFLYALDSTGRIQVKRTDLNTMLKQSDVFDDNTVRWISKSSDLSINGDLVELRVSGREQAIQILREVFDPNILDKWKPGTVSRKRSSKQGAATEDKTEKKGKDSGNKKSGKTSNSGSSSTTGRLGSSKMLSQLISDGFFKEKRTLGDIISHCDSKLASLYKRSDFTPILPRLVRDKKLKREANSDGQYEYYT